MSPESGRRFGPYEIHSRLGGGGMGHVYKAWDARLHREVAIKLLHNEFAMPGMRERFLREARAASALNHSNICTIFDIGEQDGDPYLVMELLEGETLRDRIQSRTIQNEELICVAKEVAEALGAAHAKGVIHRDIKPANIFLVDRPNHSFQAKVLDFGLAKIEGGVLGARGSRSLDITTAGSTVGTLAYMSPEQARGEMLDSRSDLFSLGVVLYEMATRHVPFQGATSALVFVKLLNHPPEPVRDWNEAIPKDLERIIFKLLAKERTARFQTAQELVEALSHMGEKTDRSSWLRKAVATVPLVRVPDPIARERRAPSTRKTSGGFPAPQRESAPPTPAEATPRPSNDAPQFLRPIARVPRGDTTPRPVPAPLPNSAEASQTSGSLAEDQHGAGDTPASTPLLPGPSQGEPGVAAARQHGDAAQAVQFANADAGTIHPPAVKTEGDRADPTEGAVASTFFQADERRPSAVRPWLTPRNLILAIVVLVLLAAGAIHLMNRGHFSSALLTEDEPLVLTEVDNLTGDRSLDGTVAQGLQIALQQSPYLRLLGVTSYGSALRRRTLEDASMTGPIAAHDVAKRLRTVAYLIGSVRGSTAPYVIQIEMRSTSTNDVLSTAEERVASLQEVPAAIDRLAVDIRSAAGEEGDSITRNSNPLSREGTGNVEALHAYAQGEIARCESSNIDALRFYQQASALDPKFVQPQLRQVTIYRRLRAEVAAADAARQALAAAADGASERMRALAQYEYEMNASGDYVRATGIIRHLLSLSPHDSEALEALARTLRLQGHMAEALQSAQQAYAEDPYNADAYAQAESSLVGLDRYDASYQLEEQVVKLGLARANNELASAYLEGRQPAVDQAIAAFEAPRPTFRPDWTYGIFLDNGGRLSSGGSLWRTRAEAATKIGGLESSGAFLLAQGALDRALVGDCPDAEAMAREADGLPQGLVALFNAGMSHALCGNAMRAKQIGMELQSQFPQSFAVTGFYLANLQAAIDLHDGDPQAALDILRPARQYDLISLTPYLRGRAHVALRQTQIGIVDFQTVLAHRGVTFLVGSDVYPVAEIGVARAFADTGDQGNSAQAYRHFLELWKDADVGQPLLAEAQARTR